MLLPKYIRNIGIATIILGGPYFTINYLLKLNSEYSNCNVKYQNINHISKWDDIKNVLRWNP